ncbi:MAG TPA: DUF4038 domain-containing protein [Kofleriaceae bacterium]|nr:DUF4038 domain-containing protein [Kofleriaceae bacterium]
MRVLAGLPMILLALAAACGSRALSPPPVCAATSAPSALRFPIGRHGACLVDASGAPVWLQGEAAWSLIARLADADLERYLADRQARGFNAILVNLIEHEFADHPPNDAAGNAPFLAPGDFTRPNEAYFAHVDRVLARAAAHGMVVLLAPAYLGYHGGDEGWYGEVRKAGPAAMHAYGRFLGARYRDTPNVIWVEGGDTAPMQASDEVDALVQGIRETDAAHLHTAHSTRQASALDDYARPWLGLNTTYSDCDSHPDKLLADATRERSIPTMFIEGTYENEGATIACTISQAYRTLLSGAAGHVFGNRPIWLFDRGWQAALDSPGSRAMQVLAALVASRDLRGLVPDLDGSIVQAEGGRRARPIAAATARDLVLAFVEAGPRLVRVVPRSAPAIASWFDPQTGAITRAASVPAGAPLALRAPQGGPWLLIVEPATAR